MNRLPYKYIIKNNIIKKLACLVAVAALVAGTEQSVRAESAEERLNVQRQMAVESNEIEGWPAGPTVSAESAILMDADSGTILYAKNINEHEYPASCTKILTCLIAAERCSMDETVVISKTAVADTPRDSSHVALDTGEEITMEQALSAILISSANEAAFAVAEHISGNWQDFAVLMNERAKELGCTDSNFVNPNGLPDESHYTSAHDLAMIGRAFWANETLSRISHTTTLNIPATDKQPDNIVEHTRNQLLPGQRLAYPYLVGSKTGFTTVARSCLTSCAQKDGMKLICVVMKDESPLQFEDTISLFDYGFANFSKVNIASAETRYKINSADMFYSDNDIFGSSQPFLGLDGNAYAILPITISLADCKTDISYDNLKEDQAALITYSYQGIELGQAALLYTGSRSSNSFFDTADTEKDGGGSKNTVFINTITLLQVLLCMVGILILLTLIVLLLHAHPIRFSHRDKRAFSRPRRKKRRRKEAISYQDVASAMNRHRK